MASRRCWRRGRRTAGAAASPARRARGEPTVIMVVGVNGAGKTTSIGKLTRHLADAGQAVLLAAADTFRAAAREQLLVWADRNRSRSSASRGGDPAAVTFDAVVAARRAARRGDRRHRQPPHPQAHLMEELKKIRRTIAKARKARRTRCCWSSTATLAERAVAGAGLRRGARPDRARHHQARRHRQGRRAGGARALVARGKPRRCRSTSSASARAGRPADLRRASSRRPAFRLRPPSQVPSPGSADGRCASAG